MSMTREQAINLIAEFMVIDDWSLVYLPDLHDALELAITALKICNDCVWYKERPQGEWIDESKDALKCSACGKWVYKPFIGGFPTERTQHYKPNYCAFCGASMVQKEGDEK